MSSEFRHPHEIGVINGVILIGHPPPPDPHTVAAGRMKQLEAKLKDPACEFQTVNITKMLELYKGGFILPPGKEVWLAQGEVFPSYEEAAEKGPPLTVEVCPDKNKSWITSLIPNQKKFYEFSSMILPPPMPVSQVGAQNPM